jgi:hypothetical protein
MFMDDLLIIVEKLTKKGIEVTGFSRSSDPETDDEVRLKNGYYLTVNLVESYIMLWHDKGEDTVMLGEIPNNNYATTIKQKIQ